MLRESELTRVDGITIREIAVRDTETDEETTKWQVEHESLDRPPRADTAADALRVFAKCVESDDEEIRIDLESL